MLLIYIIYGYYSICGKRNKLLKWYSNILGKLLRLPLCPSPKKIIYYWSYSLSKRSGESRPEISLFNAQENGAGGANENYWTLFYRCTRLKNWFWYIRTPGGKLMITACCQIIVILRYFWSVFFKLLQIY